jgi:endonuclease/exonuclease/phosphatase family metal-dependent hydrolase
LGLSSVEKIISNSSLVQGNSLENKLVVTAIGPMGNIYLPRKMSKEDIHRFARKLVDKAKISVLMLPQEQGQVRVWAEEGEFTLPQDAKKILGEDHPFLTQVTEDLIRVCHHPNAGDLTFMGFKPGHKPMTFPVENGSHAGPGPEETNSFALLPSDIVPRQREQAYLTPTDLRAAAMRFLKRPLSPELNKYSEIFISRKPGAVPETIRIMTYNVHSCIGTDSKISPERIARVIRRHEPDIVALQELDMSKQRTQGVDQPHIIAKQLEMMYHFYPSIQVEEEQYGNAVLSSYPMELIRAGRLPSITRNLIVEPRGAIWTVINIAGTKINFFNTHLGLFSIEGIYQTKALLGSEWLAHPACLGPVILCGDFNALPNSQLCRNIKKVFRDAQEELDNHSPKSTWFSHYPIGRIDHVFVSPEIEVAHVEVSRTGLDKIASDHLSLIVDIKLKN